MNTKEFDLVIFGATSFVGQLVCDYLLHEAIDANLNWAMAGRSQSKLRKIKSDLGEKAARLPLFIADSFDETALKNLCERTNLIVSTVGPYALYGESLIKVCAQSGTDYCDLTGEHQWIRRMTRAYQREAEASGARIVNCCGFDSMPSDLGVKFLQQSALKKFGTTCDKVRFRVKSIKGHASGGTIASMVNIFKETADDEELQEEFKNLYSLCPDDHSNKVRQRLIDVEYDKVFKSWVGPFVMAGINTRVVLRSNALMTPPYAKQFHYDEGTLVGNGKKGRKKAKRLAWLSKVGMFAMSVPLIRALIVKIFLPKPGEGPSLGEQNNGFYDLRLLGITEHGDEILTKVIGDKDPGYGSTAKMLAQAAISLRLEVSGSELPGGFWTPATAFGDKLFARLQSQAGISFEVLSTKRG